MRKGSATPRSLQQPAGIKEQIIAATVETLRDEGFAGASARAIARRGEFNQALIFYHFGSLPDLLLATLQHVAERRLEEYRRALRQLRDIPAAIAVARRQYERDMEEGHIAVLTELMAGASAMPVLGPEIVRLMEPWITFAEQTIARLIKGTLLETLVNPRDAADVLIALYVGMELMDHLDPEARLPRRLFAVGSALSTTAAPLLRPSRRAASRPQPVVIA